MPNLPDVVIAYISAYNRKDVEAMLACLANDVVFRNLSGGEVTAETLDKQSFEEMAKFGVSAFRDPVSTRHKLHHRS